jgi:uncharacterized Zn finger protein
MSFYYENYSQMTMAELKAKSKQNNKKGYSPVILETRKIATTWWGEKWCENLENYADYASRIQRGKRYVRSGTVIDLKIEEGLIKGLVQGSRSKPYKVIIKIKALSAERKNEILEIATSKIDNLESLLSGEFPEELSEVFLNPYHGLFPSPDEISINCNCPDWAVLCKHAAAVLYGVGARLDENPLMFFLLRSMDFNLFIKKTIEEKTDLMFKNIGKNSERLIPADIAKNLFGL